MSSHEPGQGPDDWLTQALRRHGALDEVGDDGFSERVLAALPPAATARPAAPRRVRWADLALPAGLGVVTAVFFAQLPALFAALQALTEQGALAALQAPQQWLPGVVALALLGAWSWSLSTGD
jgi:hypothetical protein